MLSGRVFFCHNFVLTRGNAMFFLRIFTHPEFFQSIFAEAILFFTKSASKGASKSALMNAFCIDAEVPVAPVLSQETVFPVREDVPAGTCIDVPRVLFEREEVSVAPVLGQETVFPVR